MKTINELLENVSYSEDLTSAYISNKEVEEYAKQTEQDYEDAFNDLESNLLDYSYVETEQDGRIIFHKELTYDVVFNSESDSNSKGFKEELEYCKKYIKWYNGTNESYFNDYKGGIVSVVCNETGETVFETEIK